LAGIVHLVDGFDEAAARVGSILEEKKADKVAMTELPEELIQSLEQRCATTGINLLKPPFNSADLPGALDTIQVGITRRLANRSLKHLKRPEWKRLLPRAVSARSNCWKEPI